MFLLGKYDLLRYRGKNHVRGVGNLDIKYFTSIFESCKKKQKVDTETREDEEEFEKEIEEHIHDEPESKFLAEDVAGT